MALVKSPRPRWISIWVRISKPYVPGRPLKASDFEERWVDRGYFTW